jgi:hypothetical protein
VADYYLRVNRQWSAKGKSIPRVLERVYPEVFSKYCESFEALFKRGDPTSAMALTETLLRARGGLLFEGYRGEAPSQWRKPLA